MERTIPRRIAALLGSVALTLGLSGSGTAAAASLERVSFPSTATLGSSARLDLAGALSRPDGAGPFPAVVFLHGCGGTRPNTVLWRRYFTERGFATLAVDSFTPRGVTEICRDVRAVTWKMRTADAFGALEYLNRQPFVRADRILVMGFSHGAGIALDVVSTFRLSGRPPQAPRFRAALAFYPGCGHKERENARLLAPTLIAIGADDDWTPADACRRLVERQPAGTPIRLHVYPGAAHSFDNLDRPATYLPTVLNKNSPTGRGATVGGDPAAVETAMRDVGLFLQTLAP